MFDKRKDDDRRERGNFQVFIPDRARTWEQDGVTIIEVSRTLSQRNAGENGFSPNADVSPNALVNVGGGILSNTLALRVIKVAAMSGTHMLGQRKFLDQDPIERMRTLRSLKAIRAESSIAILLSLGIHRTHAQQPWKQTQRRNLVSRNTLTQLVDNGGTLSLGINMMWEPTVTGMIPVMAVLTGDLKCPNAALNKNALPSAA